MEVLYNKVIWLVVISQLMSIGATENSKTDETNGSTALTEATTLPSTSNTKRTLLDTTTSSNSMLTTLDSNIVSGITSTAQGSTPTTTLQENSSENTKLPGSETTTPEEPTSTTRYTTTPEPTKVPGIPGHLKAVDITWSTFNLTWEKPLSDDDNLTYVVSIIRADVSSKNHYWSNCTSQENTTYSITTPNSFIYFEHASADFTYNVMVSAKILNITGNPANINVSTMPAAPYIKKIAIDPANILPDKVKLIVQLDMENGTFCPPVEALITCRDEEMNATKIQRQYTIDELTTNFTLDKLSPYTNYYCYLNISGGNSTVISFITEDIPNFKNTSVTVSRTQANVCIELLSRSDTFNSPVDILINCTALDDWDWVIEHSSALWTMSHNFSSCFTLENLSEFTNYKCNLRIPKGDRTSLLFQTLENVPTRPMDLSANEIGSHYFKLTWKKPKKIPTNLIGFNVTIIKQNISSNFSYWSRCPNANLSTYSTFTKDYNMVFDKALAGIEYEVCVRAYSTAGLGNCTCFNLSTLVAAPERFNISQQITPHVIDIGIYKVTGTITFSPTCLNGEFRQYVISYVGNRSGNPDHYNSTIIHDFDENKYAFSLRPQYSYVVNVTIRNSNYTTTQSVSFTSLAGVPTYNDSSVSNLEITPTSSEAKLRIKKEYFDNEQGTLLFLAIIVSSENITGGLMYQWNNNSQWPIPSEEVDVYYQATPAFWNPFKEENNEYDLVLGKNTSCTQNQQLCNGPLKPGKTYFVLIRMFNANYYRNTMPIMIITDPSSTLGLILGITISFLVVSLVGFVGFTLWRRGIITIIINKRNIGSPSQCKRYCKGSPTGNNRDRYPLIQFLKKTESGSATAICKESFIDHCIYLERNPDVIHKEWLDLEMQSGEMYESLENQISLLPENKRKNRYTNILPFDHSRVKLDIDKDDIVCSDYINASYIKGFSNQNEYIATQGPLPHTVRDFWKMIFQENVTVIVMVARFIESKREKCYKYFPSNHETMLFGDDIEIRCNNELHFEIYCIRTLLVRKDVKQLTVTHMQFLEWPDFGVPVGTDHMLQFCHRLRERWRNEGGKAVIHCSAGVGRTGTIIATDIIMNAIEEGKKIDVFNTVLELRKQRKFMVQTENQYMYIYQLIRGVLKDPIGDDDNDQEHLYQNIELVKSSSDGLVEVSL